MSRPRDDESDLSDPLKAAGLEIIEIRRREPLKPIRREPETEPFVLSGGCEQFDFFAAMPQGPGYTPAAAPFPARSFVKRPSSL